MCFEAFTKTLSRFRVYGSARQVGLVKLRNMSTVFLKTLQLNFWETIYGYLHKTECHDFSVELEFFLSRLRALQSTIYESRYCGAERKASLSQSPQSLTCFLALFCQAPGLGMVPAGVLATVFSVLSHLYFSSNLFCFYKLGSLDSTCLVLLFLPSGFGHCSQTQGKRYSHCISRRTSGFNLLLFLVLLPKYTDFSEILQTFLLSKIELWNGL